MDWLQLFNSNRLGSQSRTPQLLERSSFQRDYDRIVFSSAFRRLQSKTQVFPLPETDFLHTRLTHSLETSCVGRSLGNLVGTVILEKRPELISSGLVPESFASVVASASLAHDIGNPPFGHFGEAAIGEYFRNGKGEGFLGSLNESQIEDLRNYEGNALGFRILTHTLPGQSLQRGGLGLTYATLGAYMKYPKASLPKGSKKLVSEKKFGFLQSDKKTFKEVAEELGLVRKNRSDEDYIWCRHPLAFLVEAADDICYRIVDLEDGYKLNLVTFEEVEGLLIKIIGESNIRAEKYGGIIDHREKLNYLRARSISTLIQRVADEFIEHEEEILDGRYESALIDRIKAKEILDAIEDISIEKLYNCRKVVEIQAAGFEILSGLMDIFLNAVLGTDSANNKNTKRLIPDQFLLNNKNVINDEYSLILNVSQFVSGMTDTFALDTYKRLKGISMPTY